MFAQYTKMARQFLLCTLGYGIEIDDIEWVNIEPFLLCTLGYGIEINHEFSQAWE